MASQDATRRNAFLSRPAAGGGPRGVRCDGPWLRLVRRSLSNGRVDWQPATIVSYNCALVPRLTKCHYSVATTVVTLTTDGTGARLS